MSEDKTTAVEETVSETPATETTQNSSNEGLIAESKKYRKRAQDAEAKLLEYQKKFQAQEEAKLKEKEDFKTLYEQANSKIESLTNNAEKWNKYEQVKREKLLELHPADDRDSLSNLDLETLEYITNKIKSVKPNAPEVVGKARENEIKKSFSEMTEAEKVANWQNIVKSYKR